MNAIVGKLLQGIAAVIVVSILLAGFMAYFVTVPRYGIYYDGLGRQLTEAPLLMRLLFHQDRLWPGWIWFVVDWLWFFGGLGAAALLFGRGTSMTTNEKTS